MRTVSPVVDACPFWMLNIRRQIVHMGTENEKRDFLISQIEGGGGVSLHGHTLKVENCWSIWEWMLVAFWGQKNKDSEHLAEMGDVSSGMGSTVIQLYWNSTLVCYFSGSREVRQAAHKVITTTLQMGLVTPGTSIPTLVGAHGLLNKYFVFLNNIIKNWSYETKETQR